MSKRPHAESQSFTNVRFCLKQVAQKLAEYVEPFSITKIKFWAVVVVKWSACLPFTTAIQVRMLRTPTVFSVKFEIEKNKNKQKRGRGWTYYKKFW